ncbi:T9SS type A sorting domain-containing protein [Sediminibacterium ginsengisoli]|nr:T9SS type A sorting domain-containing protein [Sediminibacterium ginsengisoli]
MRCKSVYMMVVLLLLTIAGKSQLLTSFSFGSMGMSDNTVTASGGAAIVFDGKGKCVSVLSGVNTLMTSEIKSGVFGESCREIPPVAAVDLSLTVYPNPTKGMSILQCKGTIDESLSCLVRVISADGKTVLNQMVSVTALKAGFMINLNAHAAGTYTVMAELMNKRYSLRLIKL